MKADCISDSEAIETEILYNLEVEGSPHSSHKDDPNQSETNEVYADKPLADKESLAHYEEEMEVARKPEKKLTKRLRGTNKVRDW